MDSSQIAHVAVLGLGHMGLPIALNLRKAGFDVIGYARSGVPPEASENGIDVTKNVAAATVKAEVVISMLPDLPQLEPLLDDVFAGSDHAKLLVVMSTVSPIAIAELGKRLAERGIDVVDAPVSGGTKGAWSGALSIMCGGTEDAFARAESVLRAVGTTVTHLGPIGSGALAKACNQLVVASTVAALSEATVLARSNGLNVGAMLGVLAGGLASSEVLEQKRGALVTEDYTVSGAAKFMVKDLGFAADAGEGLELPLLSTLRGEFDDLVADGLGDDDVVVIAEHLRRRSAAKGE